jgi:hypothetical protein
MNEFKVTWEMETDEGTNNGEIALKTQAAAEHLRECFIEEGQKATVFGRNSPASEWKEMVSECP